MIAGPVPLRVWITVGVLLALVALGAVLSWRYHAALQAAETALEQLRDAQATATATKDVTAKVDDALTDRADLEKVAATTRAAARRATEELTDADPDVRAARDRPVDQRLRDIARARRLARDRSAGAAAGGEGADGAPPDRG